MARFKMLTARALMLISWLVAGAVVLVVAYEGSAVVAHLASLYQWR